MCYTARDSLIAYIINFVSSLILFFTSESTDYKVIALFLLYIGQMQIFDYIFWTNPTCESINKLATRGAIIVNHLQPIILIVIQYWYQMNISYESLVILLLYSIFVIRYTIRIWPDKNCVQAPSSVCCSLPTIYSDNSKIIKWDWNHQNDTNLTYMLYVLSLTVSSFNFVDNPYLLASINLGSLREKNKIFSLKVVSKPLRLRRFILHFIKNTSFIRIHGTNLVLYC
jgi:hypothetical protein